MGVVHVHAAPLVVIQFRSIVGLLELKTSLPGVFIFPAAHNSNLILLKKAWSSRPEPVHDVRLFTTVGHTGFKLKVGTGRRLCWQMLTIKV